MALAGVCKQRNSADGFSLTAKAWSGLTLDTHILFWWRGFCLDWPRRTADGPIRGHLSAEFFSFLSNATSALVVAHRGGAQRRGRRAAPPLLYASCCSCRDCRPLAEQPGDCAANI